MPEQPNPWFALIRTAREYATLCIERDHGPAWTRASALEMAVEGLPDCEPVRSWMGALLVRAIDEAIYLAVLRLSEGT